MVSVLSESKSEAVKGNYESRLSSVVTDTIASRSTANSNGTFVPFKKGALLRQSQYSVFSRRFLDC